MERGVSRVRKEMERGEPREKVAKDLTALKKQVEKEIKDVEKKI